MDRPDGLTAILTLMMVLAVSIGTAVLSRDTHTERALIQELHDPGVRIAAETILSEESYAVRMEVRGDREYEKANQNRISDSRTESHHLLFFRRKPMVYKVSSGNRS